MDIATQLKAVRDRMAIAAERAGRRPEEIELVAVTKTWPAETVLAAYEAGQRHFGENRAEELSSKRATVEYALGSNPGIVWHAIGALQSRKTNMVADSATVFHAMLRPKIAQRLSNRLVENGRVETDLLDVFVEVNLSGEKNKAGIDCSDWEEDGRQRENLLAMAQLVHDLPGLRPLGLMTMAPWQVEEQVIRDVFNRTRRLSEWLQSQFESPEWSHLSMGMTDDFELAILEGATHVRVGRAIFGSRG